MLKINGFQTDEFINTLENIQKDIAISMDESETIYTYNSKEFCLFELNLRNFIVKSSIELDDSFFAFSTFRNVRANDEYFEITSNGGIKLLDGVSSYDAIQDILINSRKYASECATAMVIVYFLALCKMYGKEKFDNLFKNITLMNWHYLHPLIREIGRINRYNDYFIGDRRYFDNPDVDPKTPQWQGENVIDLGDGMFYGHGIGIKNADGIVRSLNRNRKKDSETSAFLMDNAGRPDFYKLFNA